MSRGLVGALLLGFVAAVPACFETNSCFVRGTRVWTPRGLRPIEELVPGDEVLSFDVLTRRVVTRKVGKALRASATEVFRVEAGEHAIAGVTAEHPFFDAATGAYLRVDELTVRARLLVTNGQGETAVRPLTAVSRVTPRGAGEIEVFNLSVEGDEQNYFAEGVLVHNKSPVEHDNDDDGYGEYADCDDENASINGGATEVCDDGIDNDCDGAVDLNDKGCGGTEGRLDPSEPAPEGSSGSGS